MRTATLQDLCLKVIVSNFKWYCELYCTTEDSCLKLKFEFLKKKFSFLILQKLKERGRVESEYLDFLINKYLKVLDAEWLRYWPRKTVCDRLAEIGTNLKEVTFTGFDKTWEWKEVLCYLPNLKSVAFERHCSDEFLLRLSEFCKCIEKLNIKYSRDVSDVGLMYLCCKDDDKNLHSLHASIKELTIRRTKVKDEGIAYVLKNMPSLEKIDYDGLPHVLYSIHKCNINSFDKILRWNLTHLDLQFIINEDTLGIFTNVLTVCTFVCPHLKSLYCPILSKYHLDLCSQLQELDELQLECWAEVSLDLNEFLILKGKNLTSLKIYNFCMSLSVLTQNCPQLQSLDINNVDLQHHVNDFVPMLYNLEKFAVRNPIEIPSVICLLSSVPNLNYLHFASCGLLSSDIMIQILRCCEQCKLNFINLTDLDIEFVLLKDILSSCSTLQTLKVDGCKSMYDPNLIYELQKFANSLPNKAEVCVNMMIVI